MDVNQYFYIISSLKLIQTQTSFNQDHRKNLILFQINIQILIGIYDIL